MHLFVHFLVKYKEMNGGSRRVYTVLHLNDCQLWRATCELNSMEAFFPLFAFSSLTGGLKCCNDPRAADTITEPLVIADGQ